MKKYCVLPTKMMKIDSSNKKNAFEWVYALKKAKTFESTVAYLAYLSTQFPWTYLCRLKPYLVRRHNLSKDLVFIVECKSNAEKVIRIGGVPAFYTLTSRTLKAITMFADRRPRGGAAALQQQKKRREKKLLKIKEFLVSCHQTITYLLLSARSTIAHDHITKLSC